MPFNEFLYSKRITNFRPPHIQPRQYHGRNILCVDVMFVLDAYAKYEVKERQARASKILDKGILID